MHIHAVGPGRPGVTSMGIVVDAPGYDQIMNDAPLRLVLVRRVSTAGQAVDGYGLDAQETDGRRWATIQTTPHVRMGSETSSSRCSPWSAVKTRPPMAQT